MISMRSRARSPCSIRQRCVVLIPTTTRGDFSRASRIMRTRRPIVRASSASIEHHFVHRRKALTDALGPSRGGRHPGERGAGAQATCSPSQAMCQAR